MSTRPMSLLIAVGIAATVAAAVLSQGRIASHARADDVRSREDGERLSEADRQRLEEGGPVVVKTFVASLRYGDERIAELRKLIDPRYLEEHRRPQGNLSFEKFLTGSIHSLQLSDDPRTVLCTASTAESEQETFLFRTTLHDGQVYLRPLAPPDPATGMFRVWILRTKPPRNEGTRMAGVWRADFANGVSQVCRVGDDGTVSVVDPVRTSAGMVEAREGAVVIVYEDDRIERWTPVGHRRVVEHWFPGSRFPAGTPVRGIAERFP